MKLLIKNGRLIDPANGMDAVRDILVENAKISAVGKDLKAKADKVIDAAQKIIMPGIIDMHVHLREPGREDKETIASGTRSALKGGVTSVLAMANTTPAMDCPENLERLKKIIQKTAGTNVLMAAAITEGRLGKRVTGIAALKKCGVVAISDDGNSVDDAQVFSEALKKAKQNKILVISHCEDKSLSAGGVVNLGAVSTRMGLRGISAASEYTRIKRDIELTEKSGAALHIAHVSCKESVEIIAQAKKKGIEVTAETAPHYFALSDQDVADYDTNKKVNPPLRSKEDVAAIKQGLKNGSIDCIASDHAPHTENEKDIEFDRAEFGGIGLETILAVSITELIKPGILTWPQLVEKLTVNPAKILQIDKGNLSKGQPADIIIVAPNKEWTVTKEEVVSRSKNSPFIGRRLLGKVEYTIYAGKIAFRA